MDLDPIPSLEEANQPTNPAPNLEIEPEPKTATADPVTHALGISLLIAAGIAPNRVAAIGRGGMHSVLPYSKGERQRRVEFVIRDPGMDAMARRVMWDLAELLDPTYVPAVAGLSP